MSKSKKQCIYGKLFCACCGGHYHDVLPNKYDKTKRPNGTWFRLRDKYGPRGANWESFPMNDPAIMEAGLQCPNCGNVYLNIHEHIEWVYE